jgi:hypothetical protein
MLGIEWDSDIDVFQAIRERKFYDQDLGYEFANESFESQEEAKQSWWRKHFSSKLMASEKWRQGNALLNLVTVQPRNRVPRAAIMRFLARIISNFDLDFLKNMFDGERLSIMALDPVLSRACTADVTKCEKVTKEVFEEYQSPGEYPEFRPLPQTVYTRAVKYRDRGFTITLLRPNGKIWVFKPLARAAKNVSA